MANATADCGPEDDDDDAVAAVDNLFAVLRTIVPVLLVFVKEELSIVI